MTEHEIQMVALLQHIVTTPEQFAKYAAIRHTEIMVTKNMREMTGEDTTITLHDLTRYLMDKLPDLLKMIDEEIEKIYEKK